MTEFVTTIGSAFDGLTIGSALAFALAFATVATLAIVRARGLS